MKENYLTLCPHDRKLCIIKQKLYQTVLRQTKIYLNRYPSHIVSTPSLYATLYFSWCITTFIIFMGLISFPFTFENNLHYCLLFKFIFLRHIIVAYTNIYFWEQLIFKPFSPTFVHFTIVIFTWYDFTSYYIVLPISVSFWVFQPQIICFGCIVNITT